MKKYKKRKEKVKLVGRFLNFKIIYLTKKETHFAWCVLKCTPQMKNTCSAQNTQCVHTGTVNGEVPDMCVQIAKPTFPKNGSDFCKFPKEELQLALLWGTMQHKHRLRKITSAIYRIILLLRFCQI
jgi:hypothetical protein